MTHDDLSFPPISYDTDFPEPVLPKWSVLIIQHDLHEEPALIAIPIEARTARDAYLKLHEEPQPGTEVIGVVPYIGDGVRPFQPSQADDREASRICGEAMSAMARDQHDREEADKISRSLKVKAV